MSCTEWERLIADALESPELDEHLRVCGNCRVFAHEILANQAELAALDVDEMGLAAIRRGVLGQIESERRRRNWWVWPAVAAACAAMVFVVMMLPRFRMPAPPAPVYFAKNPPVIDWVPKTPPASRHNFGPVIASATPARKSEPLVIKMLTDDPNVIIIWLVDKKGDSL
jgi:hypothetical protein